MLERFTCGAIISVTGLYPDRVSKVAVAAYRKRDSKRERITLLTRLYDLATMSNHEYTRYKRTNLHFP